MKRCSNAIFVSDFIRRWCEDSFKLDCRSKVIHNGIDTDMFRPRTPEECLEHFPTLAGVSNIVLFSGRMIALKGIGTAVGQRPSSFRTMTFTSCSQGQGTRTNGGGRQRS